MASPELLLIPRARTEPPQLMVASEQLLIAETLRTYGGSADLVMLGDSLTQGWQWDRSWAQQISRNRKILNFGLGGDRIEHLLWRLEQGLVDQLDVPQATLLIGANNIQANLTVDQIAQGVGACLDRMRKGLPSARFLLYGVFPMRGQSPDPNPFIRKINPRLEEIALARGVDFHDIGDCFRNDAGEVPASLMPDGVHLTGTAYDIWSHDLLPWLENANTGRDSKGEPALSGRHS